MDSTANERQKRRSIRLNDEGIRKYSLLVHHLCLPAFQQMSLYFRDPNAAEVLIKTAENFLAEKPINVSQVKQISPFRYPGGKTWLVPEARAWLRHLKHRPSIFIEPFAGGAITALTVAAEYLADHVIFAEIDEDVAAVWKVILGSRSADFDWLCEQILSLEVSLRNVRQIIDTSPRNLRCRAFRTIVMNRTQRGGILAPGAGLVKTGENNKGLASRWYPQTLVTRMKLIRQMRPRITFSSRDAFELIAEYVDRPDVAFFIDPPYTAGGKRAGSRLYRHWFIDHTHLFDLMSRVRGNYLMTYDATEEVRRLAGENGMSVRPIPMKNTHHAVMHELLISRA